MDPHDRQRDRHHDHRTGVLMCEFWYPVISSHAFCSELMDVWERQETRWDDEDQERREGGRVRGREEEV